MNLESEAMQVQRPQNITVPVAAGAAFVVLVLCSAVYSVLHYLF